MPRPRLRLVAKRLPGPRETRPRSRKRPAGYPGRSSGWCDRISYWSAWVPVLVTVLSVVPFVLWIEKISFPVPSVIWKSATPW